jgi:hypothetical protein
MPWAERSSFLIQRFSARCIDRDIADERAGMNAGLDKNAQMSGGAPGADRSASARSPLGVGWHLD